MFFSCDVYSLYVGAVSILLELSSQAIRGVLTVFAVAKRNVKEFLLS